MARFPAKDVASWLGNSVPVAMSHYAMPSAESFRAAVSGSTSGSIYGLVSNEAGDVSDEGQ